MGSAAPAVAQYPYVMIFVRRCHRQYPLLFLSLVLFPSFPSLLFIFLFLLFSQTMSRRTSLPYISLSALLRGYCSYLITTTTPSFPPFLSSLLYHQHMLLRLVIPP